MCSIDKSIDKISRYFWYRDTKKYRGIRDTSIVKFWYRDISKYRQYRPSLPTTSHLGKFQMAISPQGVVRSTSCLVLRGILGVGGSNGAKSN